MKDYEEFKKWSIRWSWIFVFVLAAGLLSWAMTMMTLVPDVPRDWEFGNLDFTPAASIYSSKYPDEKLNEIELEQKELKGQFDLSKSGKMPPNLMIVPLPEGEPMEEVQKEEKINKDKNE